jgi:hypothetical protein
LSLTQLNKDNIIQTLPAEIAIQSNKLEESKLGSFYSENTVLNLFRTDCLRSLSFSDIDARKHNITLAHQDTCNWLFETSEFQQWRHGNNLLQHNRVLWIKGNPGAGKSTLMKHILLYCQENLEDYIIAAYFFNARGSKLEKTPLGMLRSLLYQLLDRDRLICERFIPMFLDKQKKHGKDWGWHAEELKNFLLSEMKKPQAKPFAIFIDALDECAESEARDVVSFLETLSATAVSSNIVLNICLSSRYYPNISIKKALELRVEKARGHVQDITKYVQEKLRVTNKEIEQELLQKAEHIFMWVVLVVEMLNKAFDDGEIRAMQKKLREIPSDLDDVFFTLLKKDNPRKQETTLMLQWVLFAKKLLKPEELYFAVLAGAGSEGLRAWNQSIDTPDIIKRFITSTSKGLVEVRKGDRETVQFIHESVTDFLLRNKRLQSLDPLLEQNAISISHDRLAACCTSYIMLKELEPFVKGTSYTERRKFKNILGLKYPFLEYSVTYVFYHAEEAQVGGVAQDALLQLLLRPHREFTQFGSIHDIFLEGTNYIGDTELLYILSVHGCYRLMQVILKEGGDVNAQGGYFGNALQAASYSWNERVIALLLEKGANVNAQGGFYGNALQAASYSQNERVIALLLEKGANVNAQGGFYGNALQAASCTGNERVIALLLEKRANVNAQGGYYGNALQAASCFGSERVIALLLEKEANVNAQGGYYGNALQAASCFGSERVIALLLERRANVNAQGGYYGNALQAASSMGRDGIVQ